MIYEIVKEEINNWDVEGLLEHDEYEYDTRG